MKHNEEDSLVEEKVKKFAETVLSAAQENLDIIINGEKFIIWHESRYSINNQGGNLCDDKEVNYFGRNLEYIIRIHEKEIPLIIQLYKNETGFYRIFCLLIEIKC